MGKTPEDNTSSSNSYTADEDSDSTESEIEDQEVLIPSEDPRKKREEEKKKLYDLMIRLKQSQCAKNHHVCPEASCEFTNAKEEKVANHVITQHAKSQFVKKAIKDIQRIKIEKEEKKRDREENKDKRTQEKKEERDRKDMENMREAIKKMQEEEALQAEAQRQLEQEYKQRREAIKREDIKKEEKIETETERGSEEESEEERDPPKRQKKKKRKKDKKESEEDEKKDNPKKKKKKKDKNRGKGDPSDSSDSSSDSDENKDEEGMGTKGGRRNKQPIQKLKFDWDDFIHPACLADNPSEALQYFVKKEALTRGDIPNPNRAYGKKKTKPMRCLLVAPLFEVRYKEIFKDLGLENAATEELMAWYHGWQEAKKDGEWERDDIRLQISNGYDQLMESKFGQVKNLMEAAPQLKSKRSLKNMTPQDVKE